VLLVVLLRQLQLRSPLLRLVLNLRALQLKGHPPSLQTLQVLSHPAHLPINQVSSLLANQVLSQVNNQRLSQVLNQVVNLLNQQVNLPDSHLHSHPDSLPEVLLLSLLPCLLRHHLTRQSLGDKSLGTREDTDRADCARTTAQIMELVK
jgi:hypothetical protein